MKTAHSGPPDGGLSSAEASRLLQHLLRHARLHQTRPTPMSLELRSLEFWRAIIAECLAAFVYVFLACGAHAAWPAHAANALTRSLAAGLAMAAATHCFGPISGAHANPALSLAMLATRRVSPLRALLYVTAQCGGAIAGAALLFGLTAPSGGHREPLGVTQVGEGVSAWQAAGLEAVLTAFVAFALFAALDAARRPFPGDCALAIGAAHVVCTLVALPATGASLNPARSLGPAFVTNTWTHHWVYWCGPVSGGLLAGLIYEYIFESPRKELFKEKEESVKDASEVLDETESKSSMTLPPRPSHVQQATPCFRAPPEVPRPQSRGPYAKYAQQLPPPASSYYSTVPRGGSTTGPAYRTWANSNNASDYGNASQFKF